MNKSVFSLFAIAFFLGCIGGKTKTVDTATLMKKADIGEYSIATFAGGCFWCIESKLQDLNGVEGAISGYSGGLEENPTYEEVSNGKTGHLEAVQVYYNPDVISYDELLYTFIQSIDPTDDGGQFADRGSQYKTAVFYHDEKQLESAKKLFTEIDMSKKFDKPVATKILKYKGFYEAEDYHQDYYMKNPIRYKSYSQASGREKFIDENWKNNDSWQNFIMPQDEELKRELTSEQYRITRENGTEPAFSNEYNNNKKEGIYVDIIAGQPLFSSTDKFDSGTGWPSFTKPIDEEHIVKNVDKTLGMKRIEVRSERGDAHLGHVFTDGPKPEGLRYCINGGSLEFIPKEKMVERGYEEYLSLFS